MIYKYDAFVELPDDETALALMDELHLPLCGGTVEAAADGTIVHECTRPWELRISEFRPVLPVPPVPADAVAMPEDPSLVNFNDDEKLVSQVEEALDGNL